MNRLNTMAPSHHGTVTPWQMATPSHHGKWQHHHTMANGNTITAVTPWQMATPSRRHTMAIGNTITPWQMATPSHHGTITPWQMATPSHHGKWQHHHTMANGNTMAIGNTITPWQMATPSHHGNWQHHHTMATPSHHGNWLFKEFLTHGRHCVHNRVKLLTRGWEAFARGVTTVIERGHSSSYLESTTSLPT